MPDPDLESVMRHEFGHVVTLLGIAGGDTYLLEGIAEFMEEDGRPANTYHRLNGLRQFLARAARKGDIEKVSVYRPQSQGGYAIGYLTWRCIADRLGEAKMWDVATQIIRD